MLKLLKYVYHYGVANAFRRILAGASFRPRNVGTAYFLRYGVGGICGLGLTQRRRTVKSLVASASRINIVVTFQWGGGATSYVRRQIADAPAEDLMIVCRPSDIPGVLYCECWKAGEKRQFFICRGFAAFKGIPRQKKVVLVVNELVTWENFFGERWMTERVASDLAAALLDLKHKLGCRLCYLVHDYFSVCPRWCLVDLDNRYCGSEFSLRKCQGCLRDDSPEYRHEGGLDIRKWREAFARLLNAADEVRTFSRDAYERLRRIYPAASLTLVPHKPAGDPLRRPRLSHRGIVVGVFGLNLEIKGRAMVDELEDYLMTLRREDARVVRVAHYERNEMPDIVERNGINIAFFSSVWPETFSYVTQELMEMEVPIVCYNLGAPAERVASYERGLVIPEMTVESTWRTIEQLAVKLQREGARSHA